MRTRSRLVAWLTLAIVAAVLAACGRQQPIPDEFTLTVTVAGTGTGTVTSAPAGITVTSGDDPAAADFTEGTEVELTATPATGSFFAGWAGACTGTGTCTVTMDDDVFVTATFSEVVPDTFALTVTVAGEGTGGVTSVPAGISVTTGDAPATASFVDGTEVELTATPATGSFFAGWSGDCTGTGTCTVTMDDDVFVTATFSEIMHDLTVTVDGDGTGTVTSEPTGISVATGDDPATASFVFGTEVELTATPAAGSEFVGWSGDCTGTGTCVVTMDEDVDVTATFAVIFHTLTIEFFGNGAGNVRDDAAGIDLTATGSFDFAQGTQVELSATAEAGSFFVGWGGPCSGMGDCVIDLDDDVTVTVEFALDTDVVTDTFAILTGNDDAEEFEEFANVLFPQGAVQLDSSDLDFTWDTAGTPDRGRVIVGLRYGSVTLPRGAVIRSASITFTTIESAGSVTLNIDAQAADDAEPFEGGRIDENPGTLFNISDRTRTNASVSWASLTDWAATASTPDLSTIVQEIVDRDGWSSGNALAFIIQSPDSDVDNRRTAHAFESDPALAPTFTVTYYVPTAP